MKDLEKQNTTQIASEIEINIIDGFFFRLSILCCLQENLKSEFKFCEMELNVFNTNSELMTIG